MIGIGVMSGSSLDGLDVALVEFKEGSSIDWQLHKSYAFDLPQSLITSLKNIIEQKPFEIAETQNHFTQFVGESLQTFISQFSINIKIDFVAVHGHTVLHDINNQFSWQLLNGGQLCALIGQNVICDFRNQDMGLGGQGTPMAVLADRDLFEGSDYYINLGGIANISYLDNKKWMAYDTSPCNQVLNYFAQREGLPFDKDGTLARSGHVDSKLLQSLLAHEYIKAEPPKSLDNTWIKDIWIKSMLSYELSNQDFLRTYIEFLAMTINDIIHTNGGNVLLTGGGAKHIFLVDRLRSLAQAKIEFLIPDEKVIDFKESILIAYAGFRRYTGKVNFIGTATGATRDVIGGAMYVTNNLERE